MTKLAKYLKPYIGILAVAFVLLFGQAMLDLSLPNLMSSIVNVGIQQGGITETAPKVVQKQDLEIFKTFMSSEDKSIIESAYSPANAENMGDKFTKFSKTYPNATPELSLYLSGDEKAAGGAFSRGSYALVQFMQANIPQDSQTHTEGEGATTSMDLSQIGQLAPMLAAPGMQEKIDLAIKTAVATPESMVTQTSSIFIKSFYKSLGVNTDKLQNDYILLQGLKMLGLSIALCAAAVSVGFLASKMGAGVARDLRKNVFKKVSSFTNAELDRFSTASLITRTTNDITQVQGFLTMGLRILCYAPIMGIGGTFMALAKSTSMAWVILIGVLLLLGVMVTIFSIAMPRFTKMQQLVDRLNLVSREGLSGMMVIRAFNTQKFEEDRFETANKELTHNNLFVFRSVAFMMPAMTLIMNGISLLIVWVGAKQIASSGMQVGDLLAFMQYSMQIIMSFLMISMMFIMLPRASVSGKRIYEVLSSDSSVKDPVQPKHLPAKVKGEIAFKNVCFKYDGADENVLENIDFVANAGETTAFIGSTGSGKSTIVNLIPRFYDVTQGQITIDGVDIRDITQHELRNAIGYVPQKGTLFSGDISSNLRLGREDAKDELLRSASETAQATEFINNLDNGYNSEISQGGTNVSGGQRQRLSIARALVKQSPIYIFDDTFSALDFKTDAQLRKALVGYTGGATVLLVAQRISTIATAEKIVVLDEGRIVGIGTHEELMNNCNTYREIAASQLPKEELDKWQK